MIPKLRRQARLVSIISLICTVAEGVISLWLGRLAGSAALIGFALDSLVESLSAGIMLWRFGPGDALDPEAEAQVERKAASFIGWTFIILGGYVLYESLEKLINREAPHRSFWGVVMAAVALVVMTALASIKRRLGEKLDSESLVADSKESLVCGMLSAALLVGLGLNYLWGLWWADPAAGLLIVVFLFREGYEVLMGEGEGGCGGCCSTGCQADEAGSAALEGEASSPEPNVTDQPEPPS
jgi:divalent metal cation (Fe/Co/Zn/Cd) transporter